MQAKAKANSVVTARRISDTQLGFTVLGFEEQVFDLAKVAASNRAYAEIHGWGQRIPDKAAIPVDDKDGNIVPKAERSRLKYEAIKKVIAHYESGSAEWGMRSARIEMEKDHSITLQAVAEIQGVTIEAVNTAVVRMMENFKVSRTVVLDTWAGDTKFATRIAEIRAERIAASGVDTAAILASLPTAE